MKQTKKAVCAALVCGMLSVMTACGESSSQAANSTPPPASSFAESSSAAQTTESSSSEYALSNTPLTGVKYDTADCKPASLNPGDTVSGEITWCEGPVATYQEGHSVIMYNKMQFYAVDINDIYVLYASPNTTGPAGSLRLLSSQVEKFATSYREGMTEEELAKIRPWTSAQIDGRAEPMPKELKDLFAEWYGEGFETDCQTAVYLVDSNIKE